MQILADNAFDDRLKFFRRLILSFIEDAFRSIDLIDLFKKQVDIDLIDPAVVSIGKAAYSMFEGFIKVFGYSDAVIVSNLSTIPELERVVYVRGGHPLPDEGSINGAHTVLKFIQNLDAKKDLVFLISGGGSAMFELPRVPLNDLVVVNKILLNSGASIEEINTVRKHLSLVKGGQILKRLKNRAFAFLMSDVPGDRIDFIASGLTACDPTTFVDAKKILEKYELMEKIPLSVREIILRGVEGLEEETVKDCEFVDEKVKSYVILKNRDFLDNIKVRAEENGFKVFDLGPDNHIDADSLVDKFLELAKSFSSFEDKPFMIIAGGEAGTKVLNPLGKGGRSQELALRVALKLTSLSIDFVFVAIGSDGVDGDTDAAGAISDSETIKKAVNQGLNPEEFLNLNNSYYFFKSMNDLIFTGPTGINLKDIYSLVVF
ncbi:MAG: DUF4147 domain-containing protein [candidate division WOR-3 bacterium]